MSGKEESVRLFDENMAAIEELIRQKTIIWRNSVLFSDLWWLGVALSVIPWIVWFAVVRRGSADRLLYAGFFVINISLVFDILGDQLGLWHYRFNVIPIVPTYVPWDLTLMPVTVMLLIQCKPAWNPYLKALVFALLTSYVAEPVITWLGIYDPKNWSYSYSVPLQFLIYLAADRLTRRNGFEQLTAAP